MKYLLLKVEKRCQTTIEKILKSIVEERRSPNLLAARIYARGGSHPGELQIGNYGLPLQQAARVYGAYRTIALETQPSGSAKAARADAV